MRRKKTDGFTQIPNHVIFDQRLKPIDFRVLCALLSYDWVFTSRDGKRQRRGEVWPSQATLARGLDVHRNTVQAALKRLEGLGYITILPRGGDGQYREGGRWLSNAYLLNMPQNDHAQKLCTVDETVHNFSTSMHNFSTSYAHPAVHESDERKNNNNHIHRASRENSSLSSCPSDDGQEEYEKGESEGPIDLWTLKPAKPPVQADEEDEMQAIQAWFRTSWERLARGKR